MTMSCTALCSLDLWIRMRCVPCRLTQGDRAARISARIVHACHATVVRARAPFQAVRCPPCGTPYARPRLGGNGKQGSGRPCSHACPVHCCYRTQKLDSTEAPELPHHSHTYSRSRRVKMAERSSVVIQSQSEHDAAVRPCKVAICA